MPLFLKRKEGPGPFKKGLVTVSIYLDIELPLLSKSPPKMKTVRGLGPALWNIFRGQPGSRSKCKLMKRAQNLGRKELEFSALKVL